MALQRANNISNSKFLGSRHLRHNLRGGVCARVERKSGGYNPTSKWSCCASIFEGLFCTALIPCMPSFGAALSTHKATVEHVTTACTAADYHTHHRKRLPVKLLQHHWLYWGGTPTTLHFVTCSVGNSCRQHLCQYRSVITARSVSPSQSSPASRELLVRGHRHEARHHIHMRSCHESQQRRKR